MELKPSYKGTDIGVIPEDWNLHRVGDVGIWLSGGTPSKSNRTYWGGDIPWVSPKDMKAPRLFDAIDHITPKAVSDGARLLPVGAILIVTRGMILAHSVPVARAERTLAFNQDIKSVVTVDWMDDQFLLYWLIANAQQLRHLTTDSTHGTKRLPTEMLFRALVPCPPLPEQRAIATALSDVDALLAKLDQLIAKKRDLKQAAMQQLLTGQIRLPGFSGEWEKSTLGQMCSFENGDRSSNYPSPGSFRQSGIPFINAGHVSEGKISSSEMNYITQEAYDRLGGGKVKTGDILFCLRGSLGKFGLVNSVFGQGAIASSLIIIRPKDAAVSREYLLCYFSSALCAEMIETWAGGAAQPNLGAKELAKFSISQPSPQEQRAIATVLSDMDAVISAIKQRRDKTKNIKQAMMQELLTGRIRLI